MPLGVPTDPGKAIIDFVSTGAQCGACLFLVAVSVFVVCKLVASRFAGSVAAFVGLSALGLCLQPRPVAVTSRSLQVGFGRTVASGCFAGAVVASAAGLRSS